MPVPRFGTKSKNAQAFKVITADLLIQQAKVRRNSFIKFYSGHFYNQFQLRSLWNDNYEISTYRVHVLYYLTDTFVMFVYLWG